MAWRLFIWLSVFDIFEMTLPDIFRESSDHAPSLSIAMHSLARIIARIYSGD